MDFNNKGIKREMHQKLVPLEMTVKQLLGKQDNKQLLEIQIVKLKVD